MQISGATHQSCAAPDIVYRSTAHKKGSEPNGTQNDGQSEEGQAGIYKHREENEADQRQTEKRKRRYQAVMDIADMVKILMKILREVDEIYHTIVEGRDDEGNDDRNV